MCWGQGSDGKLGVNSTSNKTLPTSVPFPTTSATAIATGDAHTCAITATDGAWC